MIPTRECTNCGATFDTTGATIDMPVVDIGCTHVGHFRYIPQPQPQAVGKINTILKYS